MTTRRQAQQLKAFILGSVCAPCAAVLRRDREFDDVFYSALALGPGWDSCARAAAEAPPEPSRDERVIGVLAAAAFFVAGMATAGALAWWVR